MSSDREIEPQGPGRHLSPLSARSQSFGCAVKTIAVPVLVAAFASGTACSLFAEDVIADEAAELIPAEHKLLSFNAFADIETAYICRGHVWDTRPYSAQYAAAEADLEKFGILEASVWTQSAMSDKGTSAQMGRYAYAEADYLLRYYYDIDIAKGWRLRNGVGRQWVTNPGYVGGRTLCDWQALQVLNTPWVTPYWRLRVIRKPIDETFWCIGVKRSFEIIGKLTFTIDFFGDLGDRRHYQNLYGPKAGGRDYRGGLKDLTLVGRLDYAVVEHVNIFAFVGQFCLVSDDARDAVKGMHVPEAKRDLTFGGVGVAVEF